MDWEGSKAGAIKKPLSGLLNRTLLGYSTLGCEPVAGRAVALSPSLRRSLIAKTAKFVNRNFNS